MWLYDIITPQWVDVVGNQLNLAGAHIGLKHKTILNHPRDPFGFAMWDIK